MSFRLRPGRIRRLSHLRSHPARAAGPQAGPPQELLSLSPRAASAKATGPAPCTPEARPRAGAHTRRCEMFWRHLTSKWILKVIYLPIHRKAQCLILEFYFTVNFSIKNKFHFGLQTNFPSKYKVQKKALPHKVFWIPPGPRSQRNCESPHYSSPTVLWVPVPPFCKIRRELESWKSL